MTSGNSVITFIGNNSGCFGFLIPSTTIFLASRWSAACSFWLVVKILHSHDGGKCLNTHYQVHLDALCWVMKFDGGKQVQQYSWGLIQRATRFLRFSAEDWYEEFWTDSRLHQSWILLTQIPPVITFWINSSELTYRKTCDFYACTSFLWCHCFPLQLNDREWLADNIKWAILDKEYQEKEITWVLLKDKSEPECSKYTQFI